MMNPRLIALKLLMDWEEKKTFPNLALKNALRSVGNERDRRFISALVYGVIQRKITLDHYISKCSDRLLDRLSLNVRAALRLGIYQMFYMDIPDAAACDTTVSLLKGSHSTSFLNAILRRCAREKETLLQLKKADYSVRYSIDPNLVDLLLDQYGKEIFVSLMEEIAKPTRSIYLYHNASAIDEAQFLDYMEQDGIKLTPTELPHLFCSENGFSVDESTGYKKGWYHVVGFHSAETALLFQGDGEAIDLCAAPGGKTFILASNTNRSVRCCDIHPHKADLLQKSAERLHHTHVSAHCKDATILDEKWINSADFVLCDVPCSGLGIMGKKPDIKYKRYNSVDFTETQAKILENGAAYLRRGGRLVYSTCTLDRRENEDQINHFLTKHHEFKLDKETIENGMVTYFPKDGKDGFFIAVLSKG